MNVGINGYALGSAALAAGVVWWVQDLRNGEFFPTLVYLHRSKFCSLVLGNLALVAFFFFGRVLKRLFLGSLREAEVEHLNEKLQETLYETLLLMTIFREELSARLVPYLALLLFFKVFHWLSSQRITYMETEPEASVVGYFRLLMMMCLLLLSDLGLTWWHATTVMASGPSMVILFGFEYVLLTVTVITTLVKFSFNLVNIQMEGRWEDKGVWTMYTEFLSDSVRLLVYAVFALIIFKYYGLPLHLVRQMFLSVRSFRRSLDKLLKYRRVMKDIQRRFPNPLPEELDQVDSSCIVCRDDMTPNRAKKLPCGHILHFNCLRAWMESSATCPMCRSSVFVEELTPAQRMLHPMNQQPAAPAPPLQAQPQQLYPHQQYMQQQQQQHQDPMAPPSSTPPAFTTTTTTTTSSSSSTSATNPTSMPTAPNAHLAQQLQDLNVQLQVMQAQIASIAMAMQGTQQQPPTPMSSPSVQTTSIASPLSSTSTAASSPSSSPATTTSSLPPPTTTYPTTSTSSPSSSSPSSISTHEGLHIPTEPVEALRQSGAGMGDLTTASQEGVGGGGGGDDDGSQQEEDDEEEPLDAQKLRRRRLLRFSQQGYQDQ